MFFLLGLAIVLFSMGFGVVIVSGGDMNQLWVFFDLPSLIVLLLALVGVLTATQSFRVFYEGLRAAIFPKRELSEDMRGRAASLYRLLSKTTALLTIIQLLIQAAILLRNFQFEPEFINMIGPGVGMALMTSLYGLVLIAAFFEPMVFILKKRHTKSK